MGLLTKFFALMLISAQSIFSLPESTSANAHPLVTVCYSKRHYASLMVGLGVTGMIFGGIAHKHGDKISRKLYELYDFLEKNRTISVSLLYFALVLNPLTRLGIERLVDLGLERLGPERGNDFFLCPWGTRRSNLKNLVDISLMFIFVLVLR